ncbi:hypothetical protein FQN57_002187 [Myotisia sp. PD_48]|nr:hypothetical protein FQN57_002187 [Myotisia sp. PD_48]
MAEKKHKRPDDSQSHKLKLERAKRRKLLHDASGTKDDMDGGHTPDQQPASPSTMAVTQNKPEPVELVERKKNNELKSSGNWNFAFRAGGRFLDLDPVFTQDESHFILCLENAIQVYSVSTSRPVRTFHLRGSERITGCKLSTTNPEHICVSTHSGKISIWNWTSGQRLQSHRISGSILSIQVGETSESSSDPSNQSVVFALSKGGDGRRDLSINTCQNFDSNRWHRVSILTTDTPINDFRLAVGGEIVVASAGALLVVGHKNISANPDAIQYTWREVSLPVAPICFDIRQPDRMSDAPTPKSKSNHFLPLDLALGAADGSIIVYHDIVNTLEDLENRGEIHTKLSSQKLHWHRGPVNTVRWSKDGGLETVLVLWQLDTGRKQFLPHLFSPICTLVVSPSGSKYAIKLDDNSVMVLSTSELQPIASVIGLQIPEWHGSSKSVGNNAHHSRRIPAIPHPLYTDYILLPVTASLKQRKSAASFLQTFDMRSSQQVYRQAMTRTNVSVLNTGPQGTQLTTPDMYLVQITSDGQWLATVDEWAQYQEDADILYTQSEHDSRQLSRDIHLKFWHWDEHSAEWGLVSRINSPHLSAAGDAVAILDVAVHPSTHMFATIGKDGIVRIWVPDSKVRNGGSQTDKHAAARSWRCSHAVLLEKPSPTQDSIAQLSASLSFSEDGSIVSACWSIDSNPGTVYLIDPGMGQIHLNRDGLYTGMLQGSGFLNRYLIILADNLTVWDTVTDRIMSCVAPRHDGSSESDAAGLPSLLAVNPRSQTFATCFSYNSKPLTRKASKKSNESPFRLVLFNIESPEPISQFDLKNQPLTVVPDLKSGEYTVIDSAAQVMRATSGVSAITRESTEPALPLQTTGLENIFGSSRLLPSVSAKQPKPDDQILSAVVMGEEGKAAQRGLTDIFDIGPSFTLPAVDKLFQNVVDIFSSKAVKV